MPVLNSESAIERAVCAYARSRNVTAIKLGAAYNRGIPDRLFIGGGSKLVFIEFKRPGQDLRKLQIWWYKKIGDYGFNVRVVKTIEEGRRVIDAIFE